MPTSRPLLLLLMLLAVARAADVEIANGVVSGSLEEVDGRPVWQFLGIPFAEPPVGELRFRRPQPLTRKWSQPLVATVAPMGCLQRPSDYSAWPEHLRPGHSEDCLTLNVWTPSLEAAARRSVLVWIHGGGFTNWEALPLFNGKALAVVGNVVVVTIQYRLGFLGFARLDAELVPGNNGLWDQQLALRWVHDNIAAFGGDPASVTIFGESAGAASVSYHLLNPESARLFHRAVLMSGVALNPWGILPDPAAVQSLHRRMAGDLGCRQEAAPALLSCLQGKSEAEIRGLMEREFNPVFIPILFAPTVDGEFVARSPVQDVAEGRIARKDVIIGVTDQEGGFFVKAMAMMRTGSPDPTVDRLLNASTAADMMDRMTDYFPFFPTRLSPAGRELVRLLAVSHGADDGDHHARRAAEAIGDLLFYCGVNAFADAVRKVHNTVYFYSFAHRPSTNILGVPAASWMGALHADDLQFTFAWPLAYPHLRATMTDDEVHLARRLVRDIAAFAATGAPSDPEWRPFSPERKEFYRYGLSPGPQTGGMRRDACVFWDRVLPVVNAGCGGEERPRGRDERRGDEL